MTMSTRSRTAAVLSRNAGPRAAAISSSETPGEHFVSDKGQSVRGGAARTDPLGRVDTAGSLGTADHDPLTPFLDGGELAAVDPVTSFLGGAGAALRDPEMSFLGGGESRGVPIAAPVLSRRLTSSSVALVTEEVVRFSMAATSSEAVRGIRP
jgi:hypothetical protein